MAKTLSECGPKVWILPLEMCPSSIQKKNSEEYIMHSFCISLHNEIKSIWKEHGKSYFKKIQIVKLLQWITKPPTCKRRRLLKDDWVSVFRIM